MPPKADLIERLREDARLIREHVPNEDSALRVLAGPQHADMLDEAADEIARLKGENERQSQGAAELHELVEAFRHSWETAEAALSRKQTLIEEMVEGLTGLLRILTAVGYTAGLGKTQRARMAAAQDLINKATDHG